MPIDSASTDWALLNNWEQSYGLHRYDSHPDGAHSLGENIDIVQVMTQHQQVLVEHQINKCYGNISEKAMAPHSRTLAWKILWTEEPGRLQSMGLLTVGHEERLHFHFSLSCIGEGNGNPLQCSCLENPRDGGAWCAVYGVTQSQT